MKKLKDFLVPTTIKNIIGEKVFYSTDLVFLDSTQFEKVEMILRIMIKSMLPITH